MDKVEQYVERGLAFLEGNGVAQDYEQAFYWLSEASILGSDIAESTLRKMRRMSLGTCFMGGETVRDAAPEVGSRKTALRSQAVEPIAAVADHNKRISASHRANPNRCIACGMEALTPNTSIVGAKHCSPDKGGCGTTLMIPITENGLNGGLAMQPYREIIRGHESSTYSSLGALVHMIKYDNRIDDDLRTSLIEEIARRISECGVVGQLIGIETQNPIIVPAPSSKKRSLQPVYLLAQFISEGGFDFDIALTKRSSVESKNRQSGTELAPGDVRCNDKVYGRAVLLIDDTYGEGATLRACIRALREKGAREIYFLSLCKNMFGGMKGSPVYGNDIH